MKAAAEYASIDAIHNDGELNVVQRGKLVGEWMVLHLNDPQPLPVPDSDERRALAISAVPWHRPTLRGQHSKHAKRISQIGCPMPQPNFGHWNQQPSRTATMRRLTN